MTLHGSGTDDGRGSGGGSGGSGLSYAPSSVGADPDVLAVVGYVVPIVGLVFYVIERESDYVRFHGLQAFVANLVYSLLVGLVTVLLSGGLIVAMGVLPASTAESLVPTMALVVGLVPVALAAALPLVWVYLAYRSFKGEWYEAPLIGGYVKSYVRERRVSLPG